MTSEPALLTQQLPDDVRGWWASEKYDGVRAIWTGSKLLTRSGKDLNPPLSFISSLPKNMRLDGELWMGRGTFDTLVSVIQKKNSDWADVKFMVFDLADAGTFEDRLERLKSATLPDHVEIVWHQTLTGHMELSVMEKEVVDRGGEGVVIRRPGCKYRPGRAGDVIKVKRLVADVDRWQG